MKRLLAATIALLMLLCLNMPVFALDNDRFPFTQRTVRVGISPFPNFTERGSDGNYSGILIDYLNEIKKYTGWNIEYVFNDPSTIIDLLDTGQIDLMGSMNKTPQTMELYDFAELSSGYAYSTITVKKTHTDYVPNDYNTFRGIKIAIYNKATSRVDAFQRFCSANGIEVTPVYFDDPLKWEAAFASGEVDAQLTSSAKLRDDEKIVASFKLEPYYFGVLKGNTKVLQELNHALEQINKINPNFDTDLYEKYFGESGDEMFTLTSDEKEFVRQHPVLRVAATPNEPPISYFNKNGDFCGISADVMKLLGDKTGFKLDYVPTKSFKQSLTLLKTNQVDMLIGVANDDLKKKNFNLVFSLPYLPLQTVLLHRNGINLQTLNAPVMANLYGFECDAIERCRKETYDTAHEAIHAVKKGKADFTVTSNLAAEHYIINNGKSGFTLVPLPNAKVNLSIALNTPANPTLLTILDRAIYSIDDVQQQSIILKNTSMQKNATLKSVIYANPIPAIIFVVSVGFLLLLLLFLIMNMRLRLSRKSALISDTYRIVGELSDEYILAYDFERETLSFPHHLASQMGISSPIGRDHCLEEGICQLISAFYDRHTDPNFSIEFSCQMMDGRKEMFRAICVIIYENKDKPVRGIGKLVSIQAEFDEKRQLEKMVNTDPLTGLYSKRYCEIWAEDFLKNKNPGGHHALLLIDIDNFKDANDTLGHLGGDEALKYFAGILKAVFTHGEILGRWGGDEFVVFIKDVPDKETLEKKAQELCASSHRAFNYDSASFDLSISVGISFVHDYQNFREIFQAADNALYQIKHDKKNGYQFA